MNDRVTADGNQERRPFLEPGWYRDLSNEDYHGSYGWSSSLLKVLTSKTPAHLKHGIAHPSAPSVNMALGTAVHTLVLEPDKFADEFTTAPQVDRRTKIGKAQWAEFEAASEGKVILTADQSAKARGIAAAVLNHPIAAILLQDAIVESSVYWWYRPMDPDDDTKYKAMLKVRPDAICASHSVIADLKTCTSATYTDFAGAIHKYGYHVSAAMYLEGVNQCKPLLADTGHMAYTKFIFICVENVEPYLVTVYELSPDFLEIGKASYRRALRALRDAEANDFPGFAEDIRVIEPPSWANRSHIV